MRFFAKFPDEKGSKTMPPGTHYFRTNIYPSPLEQIFDNAVTKPIPHVFIAGKQSIEDYED
jgi:hypothetical protein